MNIWIIHHYANSPDAPGDARHFSHARELIRRGHQVRIVACSFQHLTGKDNLGNQNDLSQQAESAQAWREESHDGVPFTWIRARAYKGDSFGRIFNMFEFCLRVIQRRWSAGLEKPDLILGSTPHPFAALAAERLATYYKVPFVLEVRDVWPYVLTEVGGYSHFHPFVALVDRTMRFLYRRASAILMFSRHSAPLLVRSGAPLEKIVWIPHGVDMAMSPEPRTAPDDGVFTVTYIGAHNQWNSLGTLLDAAKLLQSSGERNLLIRFVGDGSCKQELIERARAEDIRIVRFDGPIPKIQIGSVLHVSDAFIINNRKDEVSKNWMSFNKLYEYLAAGRPVLFGSCTENDPVRESGGGLSVAADDPAALADGIRQLMRCTNEERARYGELGRDHIKKFYSISVLVDRFEQVLVKVTNQTGSSSPAKTELVQRNPSDKEKFLEQ